MKSKIDRAKCKHLMAQWRSRYERDDPDMECPNCGRVWSSLNNPDLHAEYLRNLSEFKIGIESGEYPSYV